LAPTLIRSQVLADLYGRVQRGELDRKSAERQLDHLRSLRIRLLGDRVLQRLAWKIAEDLGWPDTFVSEYIALTQLQADAFVCMDSSLARSVRSIVTVAPIGVLTGNPKRLEVVCSEPAAHCRVSHRTRHLDNY
jgi:predicted nucleic acid-binding protein